MKIGFFTINTEKIEESKKFYIDIFGFHVEREFPPDAGMRIIFLSDGEGGEIELIDRGEPVESCSHRNVSIGFRVTDVEETHGMLLEHQVQILSGPIAVPSGVKLLHALDPNGVPLVFVQER
jgi:lactoylglutathione lyase